MAIYALIISPCSARSFYPNLLQEHLEPITIILHDRIIIVLNRTITLLHRTIALLNRTIILINRTLSIPVHLNSVIHFDHALARPVTKKLTILTTLRHLTPFHVKDRAISILITACSERLSAFYHKPSLTLAFFGCGLVHKLSRYLE